ncbi:unnamed protein product [Effrenium voratum]|uniref:Uncharacterized protein n=1 Tax=Effrenium voratum TaxID=2562239 RepID=A0AA36N1V4_9DINO|nr:unnamed protein product [Effrenium voratum]
MAPRSKGRRKSTNKKAAKAKAKGKSRAKARQGLVDPEPAEEASVPLPSPLPAGVGSLAQEAGAGIDPVGEEFEAECERLLDLMVAESDMQYWLPHTPTPQQPEPAPAYCFSSPFYEPSGNRQLQQWLSMAFQRLPDDTRAEVIGRLEVSANSGDAAYSSIGTACSGTDAPVLAVKAYNHMCRHLLNRDLPFEHCFSCEKNEAKQAFLMRFYTNLSDPFEEMDCLFKDTAHLAQGPGELAPEVRTGELKEIPACKDLLAGFPCQDVSNLNPNAADNRWVVKDSSKRTGKVFMDIMQYCAALLKGPNGQAFESLILENVAGLLAAPPGRNEETGEKWHSNLDYCCAAIRAAGMMVVPFMLDPRNFGMPVHRQRIWMLCIPLRLLEKSGMCEEEVAEYACRLMDTLCTTQVRPLQHFVLPRDHEAVLREYDDAISLKEKRDLRVAAVARGQAKRKRAALVSADRFVRIMEQRGEEWWLSSVPDPDVLQQFPGLCRLTERQFDLCKLQEIQFPDQRKACVELSQNQRSSSNVKGVKVGLCEIITPTGQLLVTHQARCLTGFECLLMQGIHFGRQNENTWNEFPDDLLRNLAGNAFNCWCVAAVYLVKEAVLARCHAREQIRARASGAETVLSRGISHSTDLSDFCEWPSPFNAD